LLLPVAAARPAAALVQIRTLPVPRRHGPPGCAEGIRRRPRRGGGGPCLGQHLRNPISGSAGTSTGDREDERAGARIPGHPRLDDRDRPPRFRLGEKAMTGIHDMGGMHGSGATAPEADEPVFHEAWEARMFGIAEAATFPPGFAVDRFRFLRETMPPAAY